MTLSRLQPAERSRLNDRAYAAIRESIVAGDFPMGDHLVETQLAEQLGMSRAPVREALKHLATEGLVEERAHQGSFVATYSADDVCDLYNVRVGLELTALREFMRRGADTRPLREEISAMEKAARRRRLPELVQAEVRFHRHIAEGSGNPVVARLFKDLEGPVMLVMALDDASFDDISEVASEHVPVVEAIEAGDESAATQVFHEHIMSSVGRLITRLNGDVGRLLPPMG